MDKPTCATCPYWVHTETVDEFTKLGECKRYPPKLLPSYTDDLDSDIQRQWQFAAGPIVSDDCFCGEHPDFPAFLESRKAPAVNPGDAMYWDEHGQRCMRLTTPPTAPPSPPPTPRE